MLPIDWQEASKILLTALTSAVFTGILAFMAQKFVERWLAQSLEKFKADIQASTFRQQILFSKLHERRAEAIAELYRQIVEVEHRMTFSDELYQSLKQSKAKVEPTEIAESFKSVGNLKAFLEQNRIYFSEELCSRIESLHAHLLKVGMENGIGA